MCVIGAGMIPCGGWSRDVNMQSRSRSQTPFSAHMRWFGGWGAVGAPTTFSDVYVHLCPPPCSLPGNMCPSALPPLTCPSLLRTQHSPDPKPLLPFHLLPGFTDVSIVVAVVTPHHTDFTGTLPFLAICNFCPPRSVLRFVFE